MPVQPVSIKAIKQTLTERNLAPRKSLGQNFLVDQNILDKIVRCGEVTGEDFVLEIGPGLGALTSRLVANAGHVVAVEYDRGLTEILKESFSEVTNFTLVNADIMEVDLVALIDSAKNRFSKYKVIANLPYYITTPIIFKLLESGINWDLMLFLVQKEVAQRICSKPGGKEYGSLTVMLNYFGRSELVSNVPNSVFFPAPKVDSAIVKITPHSHKESPEIYPYLQMVVQAAFAQRRKTVLNAFKGLEGYFGSRAELEGYLRQIGVDPACRGETLGFDVFLQIAKELKSRRT
ncbi:MAG TPA: 16S rRNA (adenine(1518)-N(6)/adenine(1519)-N(6))-dimethyltransferase RsmA [Bacillota bacterium]|jgi:16S rRNA (adenine1518-N6/adenine1519-N6)-dimethyltransferase|nr:16S rRNA (adenine(1518)-N(6)/adenine(1519)-N(6))-dimethyltransferase RsmA [Bacillota bacterium]HOL08886.1 16S rRNA (adenine(1518)-N(6)/adenine(1519)-N(6))-dimethyltransferase RsmA [Bacillota bacterium]HPO96579.1 16S rRNA (adenine(1518)-N(6)/adenine(1519)-N(6))-dimethyltransferase RsmA [Bacillota bacterium]